MCGHRVDEHFVVGHSWMGFGSAAGFFEKEPVGGSQDICLVDSGDATVIAGGRLAEGGVRDPRAGAAGDLSERQRHVRVGKELAGPGSHVAVGVEALGVLAEDDEVDGAGNRRGNALAGPCRADIGEEVELDAENGGRVHTTFAPRRIGVV